MEKTYKQEIAEIIRKARQEHNLTQSEFARAISWPLPKKVTKQDISRWENERTTPDYWLTFAIAWVENPNTWSNQMGKEILGILQMRVMPKER